MVEAAGVELCGVIDNRQLTENSRRSNRSKLESGRSDVHGMYTALRRTLNLSHDALNVGR
jgi:hypothetical protein